MIIKEMKHNLNGELFYVVIAENNNEYNEARVKITNECDETMARNECLNQLGEI